MFDDIQQWLEPVQAPNLLEVSREAYVAFGPEHAGRDLDVQDRETEHRDCRQTGGVRAGCDGRGRQISLAVMGLDRGALWQRFAGVPAASSEWQWRKTNGLKDPDTFAFDANFLAQQLQSLIPRDRG